jgi:hypothetical protein
VQPAVTSDYVAARDSRQHAPDYVQGLMRALRARQDLWGAEVLAQPGGPSYEAVEHYLVPSFLADPTYQTPVPYLPLCENPDSDSFALHLIDGSQIIAEGIRNWLIQGAVLPNGDEAELMHKPARVPADAPRYFFAVGAEGDEPYGAQLERLAEPALAAGHLPILQLAYHDEHGVLWKRESFASPATMAGPLTSWLRFTITSPRAARVVLAVRIDAPGFGTLDEASRAVVADGGVVLRASHPLLLEVASARIIVDLQPDEPHTVLVAVVNTPDATIEATALTVAEFDRLREEVATRWDAQLAVPTTVEVPDARVMAAMRNLLLQNLTMGHRYSIGNPYERTFLMEGHQAIQPLLWFGFADRHREQVLHLAELTNGAGPDWYESWERGAKLSAIAEHYRLTGDESVLHERLDAHRGYLESLTAMTASDPHDLLAPERYAWDIPEVIYGTHSQAVAWRGMVDILAAYRSIGHPIADEFAVAVHELGDRLRQAIEYAQVTLPDGSLFVPIPLMGDSEPFEFLPASREGNYWNLVFPYALTSGIFPPAGDQLRGVLKYMDLHGSFFLGLTRFSGLYEPIPEQGELVPHGTAGYKVAGIDNAFGIHHMRLLADLEQGDRVALCLYSKLAHGMTRGTFLDGEATTLGAVAGEYYRSSWYPPNSTSNALFLLTLRTVLAHEHYDDQAEPVRLALAPSTPRQWLEPGQRIAVAQLPTSFGAVSYSVLSALDSADPHLEVAAELDPARPALPIDLSLRVPHGWSAQSVDGPDAAHATLDDDRLHLDPHHHSYSITIRYVRMHH